MTPARRSRPRSSVPMGCTIDGGRKGGATEANGSTGAIRPARSATVKSAPVMPTPSPPDRALQTLHSRGRVTSGAATRTSGALLVADPGIEPAIDEIGQKIGEDHRHRHQEKDAQEHGIVAGE